MLCWWSGLSVSMVSTVLFAVLFGLKESAVEAQTPSQTIETKEYCLATESFDAKCLKSEIIVMNSALYGRMKIGRCLAAEGDVSSFGNGPDIVGCFVDVLHILDKRCSGKNQCEVIATTDVDLRNERPCHPALKSYLEAGYECATVIEDDRSCIVSASSNPLHIMRSTSTAKLHCGTKSQPWRLEAPAGQQINVSLLDIGVKTGHRFGQHQKSTADCRQYGYIIDKRANKNVSICGLDYERKENIYKSFSNIIEIVLIAVNNVEDSQHVLIGIKAIGCSNMIPPEDTWLRRFDNEAVVGCYSSHQTWHLRCFDNQWIGSIGNCTREVVDQKQPTEQQLVHSHVKDEVVLTVTIAFLGLVICVVIIICGVVCLKRYSVKPGKEYPYHNTVQTGGTISNVATNKSCLNNETNFELLA